MNAVGPPTVGVVMPLYNGARYVAEAIDSALAASGGFIRKLVVVDDGSDDGGLDIARSISPIVEGIRIEHGGTSAARNRGVAALDTELIAFLDEDDLWPQDGLLRRMQYLDQNPGADGVYGRVEQFICPTLSADQRRRLRFATVERPVPSVTTMLLKRERFLDVGPFRRDVGNAENVEWILRARAAGLVLAAIDHLVLRRRIHGRNTTARNHGLGLEYVRVLREHLARKKSNEE